MGLFCCFCVSNETKQIQRRFELYLAADRGQLTTVKKLIKKYPRCYSFEAMAYASGNGHLEIVQYLFTKHIHTYDEIRYCMVRAIFNGHENTLNYFVSQDYQFQDVTYDMLRLVCMYEYFGILKYLLCCDYNENDRIRILFDNIRSNKLNVVEVLITPDDFHDALSLAAIYNRINIIEYILSRNVTLQAKCDALHSAVIHENINSITTLLKHGALSIPITLCRSTLCYNKEIAKIITNSYTWDRSCELNFGIYACRRLVILNTTILSVYNILEQVLYYDDIIKYIFSFFNIVIYERRSRSRSRHPK